MHAKASQKDQCATHERRFRVACTVVCAAIALALTMLMWSERGEQHAYGSTQECSGVSSVMELASDGLMNGRGFDGLTDALTQGGFVAVEPAVVPGWFASEVLDAEFLQDGWATQDFSVVQVFMAGDEADACERVCHALTEKGWWRSTSEEGASQVFLKDQGRCRWLMLSVIAHPDGTGVLLHVQYV